jgi:hypothetical protein
VPAVRTVLGDVPAADQVLVRDVLPRLAAELGEDAAAKFFTANPARAFSWA